VRPVPVTPASQDQFAGAPRFRHRPLLRFLRLRSPIRYHEQRRGSWANRFADKKPFAIHHVVVRSFRKAEQRNRLAEATLLEVYHWNRNNVPVVGSIKKLLAIVAPSRIMTAAEGNLCTARTRREGPQGDHAFTWLDRAYAQRDGGLPVLKPAAEESGEAAVALSCQICLREKNHRSGPNFACNA